MFELRNCLQFDVLIHEVALYQFDCCYHSGIGLCDLLGCVLFVLLHFCKIVYNAVTGLAIGREDRHAPPTKKKKADEEEEEEEDLNDANYDEVCIVNRVL